MPVMPAISLSGVEFRWHSGLAPVLQVNSFEVERGEHVFLHGPSGSGKSTLLNIIAGVLAPQRGTVSCVDARLDRMRRHARDKFRVDHIGMIFQQFNLVPYLSVLDNVLLPCRFSARRRSQAGTDAEAQARRLLDELLLQDDLRERTVTQLSVGQQQRVAVARALIGKPEVIIADEPTSAFDAGLRDQFLELLLGECRTLGSTLLYVSHDLSLIRRFMRSVVMVDINRATLAAAA